MLSCEHFINQGLVINPIWKLLNCYIVEKIISEQSDMEASFPSRSSGPIIVTSVILKLQHLNIWLGEIVDK